MRIHWPITVHIVLYAVYGVWMVEVSGFVPYYTHTNSTNTFHMGICQAKAKDSGKAVCYSAMAFGEKRNAKQYARGTHTDTKN